MLKGIDVSHHNDLNKILSIIDKPDFCIIKATEGRTFNDSCFKKNIKICKENDIPFGFYHYARPENNLAVYEAEHFIEKVKPYIGECLLALDWEDKALNYPVIWILDFLNHVYKATGVRPLIYCSASYTPQLKQVLDNNYGLWVAHYTKLKKPYTGAYPFWAFWQYATPTHNYTKEVCVCDYNLFNGSKAALQAYMKPEV